MQQLTEEVISILWSWIDYLESDPQEYRVLSPAESQTLQLNLIQAVEMLRLATEPTQES